MSGLWDRLRGLFRREDFRRNPLKALWRRFIWKLRWQITRKPWVLQFKKDFRIAVARDGQGSLLYYQGYSEAETEDFIGRFLKPGMTFIDVGAHIGKYTLLGARAVGPKGEVHAFEPNPEVFGLLEENVHINNFGNVCLQRCAVSDIECERKFEVCRELTFSSLKREADFFPKRDPKREISEVVHVRCTSLDKYCSAWGRKTDLVKVDVEGAELLVFRGAVKLLRLSAENAPVWVFEYAPTNYAHFGYGSDELFGLLKQHDYGVWFYDNVDHIVPFKPSPVEPRVINLVAVKEGKRLRSLL